MSAHAYPPMTPGELPPRTNERGSGWAIAAMVVGLCGLCIPLIGLVGALLGVIALVRSARGRGMAITGIVTGVLGAVVTAVLLLGIMLPAIAMARATAREVKTTMQVHSIVQAFDGAQSANAALLAPGTNLENALAHSVAPNYWVSSRALGGASGPSFLILPGEYAPDSDLPFIVENPSIVPEDSLIVGYADGSVDTLPRAEVEQLIRDAGTAVYKADGTPWTHKP